MGPVTLNAHCSLANPLPTAQAHCPMPTAHCPRHCPLPTACSRCFPYHPNVPRESIGALFTESPIDTIYRLEGSAKFGEEHLGEHYTRGNQESELQGLARGSARLSAAYRRFQREQCAGASRPRARTKDRNLSGKSGTVNQDQRAQRQADQEIRRAAQRRSQAERQQRSRHNTATKE